ncbi:hypothetical protein AGNV_066 [Anticarsia gemmatalis multiple nucleopolyhedrovirus]|uniref:Basic DNA binding protein n=2 Tax=Alphabaculovirus TaxID=558016 RepID=A0A0S3IY46_9ABAC|nr:basic DNA binding protein [Choristoneura fumiferana DEF multiple nucleopolyhedrovirus]YP_009316081.1 hypothetical protein AGNV_066 [Anticarsia gemmatalis multiple nucleopolyhedrovirus]YP_803490.1 hypothetical protein AGNV_066 [Anticarsia gemmatalis nucleopolyhedrovirus]AAQ91776.1 basic DNA binding protein [Choristoneura fumiferana DEF multiple nucleopolyhedrovirus]ABI13879.1 hypothetical protein AGNV_066 [Anticarsia gemmatalis multiple nucleopolyhedrovirus]ALR69871.1 hypothetical protein AG
MVYRRRRSRSANGTYTRRRRSSGYKRRPGRPRTYRRSRSRSATRRTGYRRRRY